LNSFKYAPGSLKQLGTTTLSIFAYGSWGIAGISLIVFCFVYRKIEVAIAVLKCASEFVESVPTTLLIPPFFLILSLIYYMFWVFSTM